MFDTDTKQQTSTFISLVFTLIITLAAATVHYEQNSDKVLLSDVKVLTLHHGRMTNSRRSSPVPQLKCVGGSAQYKFQPKTVQCINRGSDGNDIQWECKTDMDNAYRFGHVEVTCEGYDYPNDPFILKGSCGLEYTVELTEEGRKGGSTYSYSYKSEGGVSGLFIFAGVLLVIYIIYKTCLESDPTPGRRPAADQPQPPPYGFRPEYMPQGPPPPYDESESSYSSSGFRSGYPKPGFVNPNATGGGGFWTGAATGGLLGYMFGRGNNHNVYNSGWGGGGNGWGAPRGDSFFSPSPDRTSSSSGTRTASGFGGTSRR